jgi:hypothetical protein
MKLSIPAFIHNKQLTELVNDLYTEYGEVVKVMCQPFETIKRGQFEIQVYKDAFLTLNLTLSCIFVTVNVKLCSFVISVLLRLLHTLCSVYSLFVGSGSCFLGI